MKMPASSLPARRYRLSKPGEVAARIVTQSSDGLLLLFTAAGSLAKDNVWRQASRIREQALSYRRAFSIVSAIHDCLNKGREVLFSGASAHTVVHPFNPEEEK